MTVIPLLLQTFWSCRILLPDVDRQENLKFIFVMIYN